jgi:hypothetical protein
MKILQGNAIHLVGPEGAPELLAYLKITTMARLLALKVSGKDPNPPPETIRVFGENKELEEEISLTPDSASSLMWNIATSTERMAPIGGVGSYDDQYRRILKVLHAALGLA